MTEQTKRVDDVRDVLRHLEDGFDRGFRRIEARFQGIDDRLTSMDQKLDAHFLVIDAKLSRLMTLQVATLLAVVAALAGMLSDFTR